MERVRCSAIMDNDTVSFKDAIRFRLWKPEAVSISVLMDRGSQSKLAVTSVCDFVRPDELSKAKEGIET